MKNTVLNLFPAAITQPRLRSTRLLSIAAGLLLGAIFGEFWLITLGMAIALCSLLAEGWGELPLLLAGVVPISLLIWVISSFLGLCQFHPGATLFCVISFMLLHFDMKALNAHLPACCNQ